MKIIDFKKPMTGETVRRCQSGVYEIKWASGCFSQVRRSQTKLRYVQKCGVKTPYLELLQC